MQRDFAYGGRREHQPPSLHPGTCHLPSCSTRGEAPHFWGSHLCPCRDVNAGRVLSRPAALGPSEWKQGGCTEPGVKPLPGGSSGALGWHQGLLLPCPCHVSPPQQPPRSTELGAIPPSQPLMPQPLPPLGPAWGEAPGTPKETPQGRPNPSPRAAGSGGP